jgi:hypothetical protein
VKGGKVEIVSKLHIDVVAVLGVLGIVEGMRSHEDIPHEVLRNPVIGH